MSLFDIKRRFGYQTIGAHSFSGAMFYRKKWWPDIGLQEIYFSEDMMKEGKEIVNTEAPFWGLNDEETFDFISEKAAQKQRVFAYMLTVNTHLPFTYKFNNQSFYYNERLKIRKSLYRYSDDIAMHELRIFEQIMYFVSNLPKAGWDEVLIIGDHAPPYSDKYSRNAYYQDEVPLIFIKRSN